jgi:hypothetical protein
MLYWLLGVLSRHRQPETVAYTCERCDGAIAEHHKTAMLGGDWRVS